MLNWILGSKSQGEIECWRLLADDYLTLRFDISPGEDKLKAIYETRVAVRAEYQQFSSFPTAFVLAADVELDVSMFLTQERYVPSSLTYIF